MLNFLLFVVLVIVLLIVGAFIYIARFLYGIYRQVHKTFSGQSAESQNGDRRQQSRQGKAQDQREGHRHGSGGETVFDTRPDNVAERKIFAKDEGEYIDYTEV